MFKNFIDKGSDSRTLINLAKSNPETDNEDLIKAMKKEGLVQKEIQVKGKNGVYIRKQWVKAGEDQKTDKPKKEDKKSKYVKFHKENISQLNVSEVKDKATELLNRTDLSDESTISIGGGGHTFHRTKVDGKQIWAYPGETKEYSVEDVAQRIQGFPDARVNIAERTDKPKKEDKKGGGDGDGKKSGAFAPKTKSDMVIGQPYTVTEVKGAASEFLSEGDTLLRDGQDEYILKDKNGEYKDLWEDEVEDILGEFSLEKQDKPRSLRKKDLPKQLVDELEEYYDSDPQNPVKETESYKLVTSTEHFDFYMPKRDGEDSETAEDFAKLLESGYEFTEIGNGGILSKTEPSGGGTSGQKTPVIMETLISGHDECFTVAAEVAPEVDTWVSVFHDKGMPGMVVPEEYISTSKGQK